MEVMKVAFSALCCFALALMVAASIVCIFVSVFSQEEGDEKEGGEE